MEVLTITGFKEEIGPGDIVGAFINKVGITSEDIGKINIYQDRAEVKVATKVVNKVVNVMDNNQIGLHTVKVFPQDASVLKKQEKIETKEYVDKFKKLVELERQEEMERHELEIKRLSPQAREAKGRAILKLKGRDAGTAFGDKTMVKFLRQKVKEELPETEISVGDLVLISKGNPLKGNNPTATVAEITRYSITVVFDHKVPSFIYKKGLRLDLYVNDITYQRMLQALGEIEKGEGHLLELRQKLIGLASLESVNNGQNKIEWVNSKLNIFQKKAVKKSLLAKDIYLIQGPAGTGKTITGVEIINQAVKTNKSVLATADSNIAVDNLVERLVNSNLKVIRIGHPLRVTPILRQQTLDYQVLEHPLYVQAKEIREKVNKLLVKQEQLTHPSGRWRRGMSDSEIKNNAQKNSSFRGVPKQKIKEMAKWLEIQNEIDSYFTKINSLENKAVNDLISKADVVCATNSTAGSQLMEDKFFDLLLIDEATQAMAPAALIPLIKASKIILIGDHKQLPPTVLNQTAVEQGLSESLFEQLLNIHGEDYCSLLQVQYRMNTKICNFSSKFFYNDKLKSAEQAGNHTLADLGIKVSDGDFLMEKALNPAHPFVFLDTAKMEARERSLTSSNSYDNPVEAELVLDLLNQVINLGLKHTELAIITPYKDQVELLRRKIKLEVEINTVDGFQGREKEMVIVSFVRSNLQKNIGFLSDLRRLNVTLTRAKRKLILIGDSSTISGHKTYIKLLNYVQKEGAYYIL